MYRTLAVTALFLCVFGLAACQTTAPEATPSADAATALPPPPPAYADADASARVYAGLLFLPQPRAIEFAQGGFALQGAQLNAQLDPRLDPKVQAAVDSISKSMGATAAPASRIALEVRLAPEAQVPAQGYALNIGPHGITITAQDDAGAFYAVMTLKQLLRQCTAPGVLPFLQIADHPDFAHRGVMLDIARDKVATLETLYSLVDQLAEWKCNEFQLYTEHTFAYAGHEVVWQNASPMTPEDIQALDAYCRDRFVELVPNQNSFGHMGRWLSHPEYAHLSERPESAYMLCPVDPEAIAFLKGLYDDMLPNFSSGMFNVGCDEAWEIGRGRSADAVKKRGGGRVYLDFLVQIHQLVQAHGKTMQFWGDIILQHPELIPELPGNVIAVDWGYEADHPFDAQTAKFAAAGVPFYVGPGTSSWNTIIGRTDNAIGNLRNAAINGRANGSIGYLITDWGDRGHWQFLPVSYVGYAYGAAVSWCVDANVDLDVPTTLDTHVFYDDAGVMGKLAYDLGNAYQRTNVLISNNSTLNVLIASDPTESLRQKRIAKLDVASLERTLAYIDATMAPLDTAAMKRTDAALVMDEFRTGAAMAAFGCKLAIARLNSGDKGVAAIPQAERQAFAVEWKKIVEDYQVLWKARNREGGLTDSIAHFQRILAALEQ